MIDMSFRKLSSLFVPGILLLFLAAFPSNSYAAKEGAVLLPVTGQLTPEEKKDISAEVSRRLKSDYKLIYGDEVGSFVKKVFQEESEKDICDEEACYRRIAGHFGVEKIIALRVVQKSGADYLVTFNIYDVVEGKVVVSKKVDCSNCSFERLKAICIELIK